MTTSPTYDPETLSCAIAGRYAGRWARSVAASHAREEDAQPPAPWFVDGFAGADLQRAALRGATLQPAAVAAVQALDAAEARARIVLVEEDPGLLARLADEMDRIGAGDRVRTASDPASAEPGEIVLVEAQFASVAARLASGIADDPALLRLAPLAARAMPWTALQPLATLPSADLLLRFPREDFAKQARFASPLADLPPHVRRVVEGCSTMLGDPHHGWLLAWREAERAAGMDAAVARMVERMRALLAGADEARVTRAVPVGEGPAAVHLLLSTPRAEHVLELDGALADDRPKRERRAPRSAAPKPTAASAEAPAPAAPTPPPAEPAPAPTPEPPPAEPPAPLDLFALDAPPREPPARGPDLRAVADDLHARHVSARVPVRELLAALAESGLTPEEARSALTTLKRAGRAAYRSLDAEDAEVEFVAEPRAAAPRPRKARKPAPGELGLFDEPEE